MDINLKVAILSHTRTFIDFLSDKDQSKIYSSIRSMQKGDFESAYIKTLNGPIKELRVRDYRFIFCIEFGTIYFIRAFLKKTPKTPKNEIEVALKIHKSIQDHVWNLK